MSCFSLRAPRPTRWALGPAIILLCFTGVTACGGDESPPPPTKTVTETTEPPGNTEKSDEQGNLPDMTGKDLQAAQDTAQAHGFYNLTSTDATGQDRYQVLDRNWVVCSQNPEPGKHGTDVTVDFTVVKDDESCP